MDEKKRQELQNQQKRRMAAMQRAQELLEDEAAGGSDDDSLLYAQRNFGRGVEQDDHLESVYDVDPETGERRVRKRRCKKHKGEHARYVCKDHEAVLCPKCLVTHKLCDFEAMGPTLTHQCRQRFRHLLTQLNVRFNISNATLRKVESTVQALELYREKQVDDINYNFDAIVDTLNARRDLLIGQVTEMVNKLKLDLRVDTEMAEKKRDAEGEILKKVRELQEFIFAVEAKEHKRAMVKWKHMTEYERDFDKIDFAWRD